MLTTTITTLVASTTLIIALTRSKIVKQWPYGWSIGLLLLLLIHIVQDGFYHSLIPIYTVDALFIIYLLYSKPSASRMSIIKLIWAICWRGLVLCMVALCVIATWNFGNTKIFNSWGTMLHANYSSMTWGQAFHHMHGHLQKNYAFGEWKKVQWKKLYDRFQTRIAQAEKIGDSAEYYLALREYAFSLQDGHIEISGDDYDQRTKAISGGYGLLVNRLEDGRVIAAYVDPNGPAANNNIQWGAEILEWNNMPITTAIDQTSTIWFSAPIATHANEYVQKQIFLTRAPLGTEVSISYINPNQTKRLDATLRATDDRMRLLKKAQNMGRSKITKEEESQLESPAVEFRILPQGYGYLKLNHEIPTLTMLNPVGAVAEAVSEFIKEDVGGVIIDVRGNIGGIDALAPMMMAHFSSKSLFYEQVAYMDGSSVWPTNETDQHTLIPAKEAFSGPVVMLIDNQTISTGEGYPYILKKLGRGSIVGFYGTYGSFGMVGSSIKLPLGITVHYPNGAALDEKRKILLDSDYTHQGGIMPDIQIPITKKALQAIFVEQRDFALEVAIDVIREAS